MKFRVTLYFDGPLWTFCWLNTIRLSNLWVKYRFLIFCEQVPCSYAIYFIGHCCCGVFHFSYAKTGLPFWYPEQERMKQAQLLFPLFLWGYFDLFIFFLWHHGPCVPWGWCVRSAGHWLRMRSRCQPIKAGRNQSDAQQPAASPPTPRLLPVWEHSSAFLASSFSVFVFSLPTSNSFSSHACLWWVEESSRKRQKLHLSLRHHFPVEIVQRSL